MKIYAPNKDYAGISAGVHFTQGVGETDNPVSIEWFRRHGYTLEEKQPTEKAADKKK